VRALLRRTVSKAWHDRILGLSAEAAFWQLLSLPPLILASIASLGYVANWFGPDTVSRVQTQIEAALSRGFSSEFVNETIGPTLNEVLHGQRIGLISIGFILALWAGSSGTATYVNTITIAYDMRDQRGAVRSRLLALSLFLGTFAWGYEQRRQAHPDAHQKPRVSASRRRRSRSGRALVTYGTVSKFHAGGGDVVYHSSVSASHGSLPTRAPTRVVRTTL